VIRQGGQTQKKIFHYFMDVQILLPQISDWFWLVQVGQAMNFLRTNHPLTQLTNQPVT
jgi:hypothetical protein